MKHDSVDGTTAGSAALHEMFAAEMQRCQGPLQTREAQALHVANALVRQWLERELAQLADRHGDEVVVDGQRYKRHSGGTVRYHSLCGSLAVHRDVYRQVGVHNGPTVVPLELEAGIVEKATPALALSVAQGFGTMPLRHYEQEMTAAHRRVPSRSTLERIGKRVGARLREALPVVEPVVRSRHRLPEGARSISIGLDRTTVPMAEPTGHAAKPPRGTARLRPRPINVVYRMAYVATLAVHDPRGAVLTSLRLAATAEEGPTVLMERLAAELVSVRTQRPRIPVVVVQDGAPELWFLVDECLANLGVKPAMRLLDRYHLDARLAEVSGAVADTPAEAARLLAHWQRCLDRTDSTLGRICRSLDRKIWGSFEDEFTLWPDKPPTLLGLRRAIVRKHLGYFSNGRSRAHYATARRRGFPIGSGVTEGACKSVIASRFKRSGQRWHEAGASMCLLLRTFHLNDRLAPAIDHLVNEQQRSLD